MKKSSKKVTKLERTQQKKELLEYHQKGSGLYLFRNRSEVASLELPKVSMDGKRWVGPKETWEGDSYFLSMIPKEAVLVRSLTDSKAENKEDKNMESKLILDQPDQVTSAGKVEHKVVQEDLPLNETPQSAEIKDRLLTEDPLAGVTIIRD
jgi:hypothetical protein